MAKAVKATTKKATKKPATATKKVATKKKARAASASRSQFMQPQITQESLYWLILGAVAILFAMWIYTLDARVRELYDQIDASTRSTDAALELQLLEEKAKQKAGSAAE